MNAAAAGKALELSLVSAQHLLHCSNAKLWPSVSKTTYNDAATASCRGSRGVSSWRAGLSNCSSAEDLMCQPLLQKLDCHHLAASIAPQRHNQINLPQWGLHHQPLP
jgi:hypothetical protein